MKKVIGGAVYSTETAKLLASWSNNLGSRDFKNMTESLYRTKAGKYFLHGEGGPMTKYAQSCGNNAWSGGEQIMPITRETAMKWAEENLNGDEYEAIFGEVPETDEMEALNLLIPAALKAKLKTKAETEKRSITDIVVGILEGKC